MTTPAMTVDAAFAAMTQLITYSDKLARHTNADTALDTLRATLADRDAEIAQLRAALKDAPRLFHIALSMSRLAPTSPEFQRLAQQADTITDTIRTALEGKVT